ncbi:hypothetical protein GCM10009799_04730 [Nocardiopsis rhodophaea]|uniref:OmpR/PhoB-type domain-containing protein n=2 Tax=Nocardiopsis rhodophaea TaxID=280238 RepID=A0ABP5DQ28_9ACTN
MGLLLVEAPHSVSLDAVMTALWSEEKPPRNARTAVHIHMARLRRILCDVQCGSEKIITTKRSSYQIDSSEVKIDLRLYKEACQSAQIARSKGETTLEEWHLTRAVELWNGDLLEDVPLGTDYDDRRRLLREWHLDVLERLWEIRIEQGASAQAVMLLRRLLASYPLRENAWCLLMTALMRDGRSAEAVSAFNAAREIFTEQLGIGPGMRLQSLFQEVLTA